MASRIDGIALGCMAAGGALVYAGIKGKSVPSLLTGFIQGRSPATAKKANQITPGAAGTAAAPGGVADTGGTGGIFGAITNPGGSAIATDALQYKSAGYVWGGAPANGIGNWDCSSFANWVCGHDEGLAIPGYAAGTYTGASHGPPTGVWLLWGGVTTVGHTGAVSQPGDLCIWQTHMGIAIGGGQMISAQDPQNGTQVSGIDGFIPGELLFVRRYRSA